MEAIPQAAPQGTRCLDCGFHLYGIRIDSNCPKCATPVERTLGALPTEVPDAATCIRCAYSLRGLSPQGVCPECGTPIERSLRGDLLLYSHPEYIRKLLAGARIVLWSTVTLILLVVAAIIIMFNDDWPLLQVVGLAMLAALLAFVVGWWLITWPDVGQLSSNKGQRPRRIVRYSLVAIVAVVGAVTIIPYLPLHLHRETRWLISLLTFPAMGVGFFAGMLYLRWLAPRIPDGRAHFRAKALLVLFGSIVGANILGILVIAVSSHETGPACLAGLLSFGAAIASVMAVIMYCRLFLMLRTSLATLVTAQGHGG